MPKQRVSTIYRGSQLVAGEAGDSFRGVAWSASGAGKLAEARGASIEEVIEALRVALDSPENLERIRLAVIEKHKTFLEAKGIDPTHLSVQRLEDQTHSLVRSTHCWGCKTPLDSHSDLECTGCRWIICTTCGACGHGHPVYGERYEEIASSPGYSDLALKTFQKLSDAQALAKQEPGSRLIRDQGGNGWVVVLASEPR